MHRILGVDNLSWNIVTPNSVLIFLNLENDLSLEQLVTIKLRNKAPRGWINQEPLIQWFLTIRGLWPPSKDSQHLWPMLIDRVLQYHDRSI